MNTWTARSFGPVPAFLVCALGVVAASAEAASAQVTATVEVTVRGARPAAGVNSGETPRLGAPADSSRSLGVVVGASVSVLGSGATATTGTEGKAALRGVDPGRITLVVRSMGYEETSVEVDAVNGRVARVDVVLTPLPLTVRGLEVQARADRLPPGATAIDPRTLASDVIDLPAAVDRVAGATVVRQGGPGAPAFVQLRGSNADQVLVLLDGVPLNSPLTGRADLSTVDLERLARIVVLPGAASAQYGPGALGGVVLLESRMPRGTESSGSMSVGSWAHRGASGDVSTRLDQRWTASGSVLWSRTEGDFTYEVPDFRGGGEAARLNAGQERTTADVTLHRHGLVEVAARGHVSDLRRGSPGPVAQPSTTGRQQHLRYGGSVRASTGEPFLGGTITIATQRQHAEYSDTAPPFGPAYDARTDVASSELLLEGWRGSGALSLRAGGEAAHLDVQSSSLDAASVVVDEFGVWGRVEYTSSLGASSELLISAGSRIDRHDLVEGVTLSPSLRGTVRHGGATLDVSWGRGFAPPDLGDLFFQEGVLAQPNPDLRPERVRHEVVLGIAQRWDGARGSVEAHARGYRADVDDMILWFPDHRFVWSPSNFDVARRGVELGAATSWLLLGGTHSASAHVAWSEVEYREGTLEGQVAYQPVWTGSASLGLVLPAVTVSPTLIYVGDRRSVPGSELNALRAYALLDVGVRIPFRTTPIEGSLDVTMTNALDVHAALLVDYPLPGRGWSVRLRITPSH